MHFQPGRLWNGLPVLCHRSIGSDEKHVGRRDSGTGARRRSYDARRRSGRRPRPAQQHRVHGHGRADGQLPVRAIRRAPDQRDASRSSASPRVTSPYRPSASCPASGSSRPRASRCVWPCRCTRPVMRFATSSCR